MLFADERNCLLDLGGGERVERVRWGSGAGDMLGNLLEAVEHHFRSRGRESAAQSMDRQKGCGLKSLGKLEDQLNRLLKLNI